MCLRKIEQQIRLLTVKTRKERVVLIGLAFHVGCLSPSSSVQIPNNLPDGKRTALQFCEVG